MNIDRIENYDNKQTVKKQSAIDFESIFQRDFNGGPVRRSGYKLAAWAIASFSVDALIILFLTISFILLSTIITKNFFPNENLHFINQKNIYSVLLAACIGLGWVYYLFMRLYFKATVGEMSCSIRVGKPSDRVNTTYLLKIIFRLSLITLTGFIILPLLSIVFKTDFTGKISKISLYSLK